MIKLSKIVPLFSFFILTTLVVADEQATISPWVKKSLLLASSQCGALSVVVGERGHILYSRDAKNWTQASVDSNTTLTGVFMLDDKTGWAVGHDAVILKTKDGAKTWHKIFSDIDKEAPLLDVFFSDALNGIVIGAYGLLYITPDGGESWQENELSIQQESNAPDDELDSGFTEFNDVHLNAIAHAGDDRFYIAAEAGQIFRSDNDGQFWLEMPSPYRGSFFGVLPLSYDEVLIYGLRGHLYRSADAGLSWIKIDTTTNQMLTDARVLNNGDIIVVGLAGTLLLSKDNGHSFTKVDLHHRHGLASVLEMSDSSILLTGDFGIQLLSRDKITSGQ